MKFILIACLLYSVGATAQPVDIEPVNIPAADTSVNTQTLGEEEKAEARRVKEGVQNAVGHAGDRREGSPYSFMGEFSPFDLILPWKFGGSLGYVCSRSVTYELEYLLRSAGAPSFISNIGGFDDQRLSLLYRSYASRNSFNVHYGLSYFDMGIHVAHSYLVSSGTAAEIGDLMRARSLGLIIGIGNRWAFPHGLAVGVDWISWAQPLVVLQEDSSLINGIQDQGAKSTLQDVFHLAMFFPRFTLLKLALGLTF